MATELPPGDCKAKGPQLYPYFFRPKPWSFFWPHLFHSTAPLQHFRCSERECIIGTYFQSMLGICSTIGKSHMNRNVFKHGHWAASRGLQSQGATTISILFRPKPWSMFLTTSLSFESAFCNILDVQKGSASLEHIFNPCWRSVVLLRSRIWKGVFLNMATELPPGDCKAKGPQLYPYFSGQNHDVFFWPNLFHSRAPCVRFWMYSKGMHDLNIFSIRVGDL